MRAKRTNYEMKFRRTERKPAGNNVKINNSLHDPIKHAATAIHRDKKGSIGGSE